MKRVAREELLGLAEYEAIREPFRRRVIELKKLRRVPLGSNMTALFENHDTVLFQIQEMLRTERITSQAAIEHELETYNELIPPKNALSLTIFVEYPDAAERDRMLVRLAGLEESFQLRVGERTFPLVVPGRGDRTDRTTALQYARVELDADAVAAVKAGAAEVSLEVTHAAYQAKTSLERATLESLAEDLA